MQSKTRLNSQLSQPEWQQFIISGVPAPGTSNNRYFSARILNRMEMSSLERKSEGVWVLLKGWILVDKCGLRCKLREQNVKKDTPGSTVKKKMHTKQRVICIFVNFKDSDPLTQRKGMQGSEEMKNWRFTFDVCQNYQQICLFRK